MMKRSLRSGNPEGRMKAIGAGSKSVAAVALIIVLGVPLAHPALAVSNQACLIGMAPEVANDPSQIRAVRGLVDLACLCSTFNDTPKRTHTNYVRCASYVIASQVQASRLRSQCALTMKKYYSQSTCGVDPNTHAQACIQTNLQTGAVTCAIRPTTKKDGVTPTNTCSSTSKANRVACPGVTQCIEAADTNDDLIIGAPGDSGACAQTAPTPTPTIPPVHTPTPTPTPTSPAHFCDLPGSVQFTMNGTVTVPGGNIASVSFLNLPTGFCAHAFANVGNPRQLRFAPGGELFVASPTTATTGSGPGGQAAILVLPDDNHDGVGDAASVFLSGLPSTQGLLFTSGFFYYQDGTKIMRVPYSAGDRTPSGTSSQVADITVYVSNLNWPKVLDVADDGTLYVSNSGDQVETCTDPHPFHGGILKLDGSPGGTPVVQGLRLPGGLRCSHGFDLCFATEMTRDFSDMVGGRSKVVPIRQGDDWGYPCCATQNLPFTDISPVPDCSTVAAENVSLAVRDRPNDLDFSPATWPAPWSNSAFVTQHGEEGDWKGARVVAIQTDGMSGQLLPSSDVGGSNTGAMSDFATGWDGTMQTHGRPANVAFASDGRLFLGNDTNGDIVWIAPLDLPLQ